MRSVARLSHYLLLAVANSALFLSPGQAGSGDWWRYFHPSMEAMRTVILRYHQFPWWNPWSMAGVPLFADPQLAPLTLDAIFVLAFGPVAGLKLAVLAYIVVGYEGTAALCRHLFGDRPVVRAACVLPVLLPPLALHLYEGHFVLASFYLFPCLLWLALSWRLSWRRSLGLGLACGYLLLANVHYMAVMEMSLVALVVVGGLARRWPARREAAYLLMAATAALSLCLVRVALTLDFTLGFPRMGSTEASLYPISFHPLLAGVTLIAPLQSAHWPTFANHWIQFRPAAAPMGWWEVGAYVGVLALTSAWFGATLGGRFHMKPWLAAATVLFVMAWTNRYPFSPSYYLHFLPGYSSILVITRWRIFACFLVLICAVAGIVALHDAGRKRLASVLLLGIALDLSAHTVIAWYGAFGRDPPPTMENATPPIAVTGAPDDYWPALRATRTFLNADEPVLGYVNPALAIIPVTDPAYRGEFYGSTVVRLVSWTPNRIALDGSPGDVVRLNINPGSYWQLNDRPLFPHDRAMEVHKPFEVTVPASGHIVLTIIPAGLRALVMAQAACALMTMTLAIGFVRLD